jgi:hypothetical protein
LKTSKVKIEIFFPFGSCACSFAPLLEKVGRVASKFKGLVDFDMRSTGSKEASQYGVKDSCVIVNGTVKLAPDFEEKILEEIIIKNL